MAYTPTEWKAGDIITSTKLNKIENELVALEGGIDNALSEINHLSPFVMATFPQSTITDEPIATFSDGADGVPVKSLVVDIDPVQDLHGQDNPYPAGGGANRFDEELELGKIDLTTGEDSPDQNYRRSKNYCACEAETTYYGKAGDNPSSFVVCFYASDKSYISYLATSDARNKAFTTPANAAYFRLYASEDRATHISINYPATVTDYTPYSNVCPISGWDGANISDTGKNLLDFTNATKTSWTIYIDNIFRRFPKNTKITMSINKLDSASHGFAIQTVNSSGVTATIAPFTFGNTDLTVTFSINDNVLAGDRLAFGGSWNGLTVEMLEAAHFQAEVGETATAYEPFGSVLPITFPDTAGTVYGGSLKLNEDGSADLTSNMGIVDLGDITWTYYEASGVFRSTAYKSPNSETLKCTQYKTIYPRSTWQDMPDMGIEIGSSDLVVKDSRYSDKDTFKTAVEGVKAVYELSTATTYHITDVGVVKTLLGLNNLWADTGDVDTLTYRVDPASYQASQTAQIISALAAMLSYTETSYTATRAYNENDFVSVNNTLFRVTASISNGGTITPDTNCVATTVGAELTTILNS